MAGEPVVVQGTPVSNPHASPAPESSGGGTNVSQNSAQTKCQDAFFAPLFYLDVVAIAVVAGAYGGNALQNSQSASSPTYEGYYKACVVSAVVGVVVSVLGLQVMMMIPQFLIKAALIFTVIMAALWVVFSFATSSSILPTVLALVFFVITCCYAYCVWSRIPFATINLVTAISAVKANCGITVFSYIFVIIAAGWSLVWAVAAMGTFDQTYHCHANNVCSGPSYGLLFLLFLAYFFAHQVLQNTIHTTIAGVVATWWIVPSEASSCCSSAIFDSLKRSLTTSFGSICFGSLLVAIIQALRALANTARSQDDGILLCLAECILACIQDLLEYFNKWAFIWVGIYGMSYCESGKAVMQLFQNRGWEAIVADDLVGNTLLLVSVIVGAITGSVAIVLEKTSGWFAGNNPGNSNLVSFLFGFVIGLVLCSILLSTIASAVNAVLVLFAEKPNDFQRNHPELSRKMRDTWAQIYPGSI